MGKDKQLEKQVRRYIDVTDAVCGVAEILRDHFEHNEGIDKDTKYYCDLAELMVQIGLFEKGIS